ncbi:MAG: hypothetical protein ACXQTS_06725, partial [Candidatus Methanospirareceae archaeon]
FQVIVIVPFFDKLPDLEVRVEGIPLWLRPRIKLYSTTFDLLFREDLRKNCAMYVENKEWAVKLMRERLNEIDFDEVTEEIVNVYEFRRDRK